MIEDMLKDDDDIASYDNQPHKGKGKDKREFFKWFMKGSCAFSWGIIWSCNIKKVDGNYVDVKIGHPIIEWNLKGIR